MLPTASISDRRLERSPSRARTAGAALLALLCGAVLTTPAAAISLGQIDDFQDGTQGWTSGGRHPTPPTQQLDAGPAGAGDHALRAQSNGVADTAGNALVFFNQSQWTGDYTAAGVTGIQLQVNTGPNDIELRLAISGPSLSFFASADGVNVPAGSGWQPVFLPVTPSSLVFTVGFDPNVENALSDVLVLRLLHATAPVHADAPPILAELLVDDIEAVAGVPEPGTALLLGVSGVLLGGSRRRRPIPVRFTDDPAEKGKPAPVRG